MEYQLEDLGANKRKLNVTVPLESVTKEIDDLAKMLRKEAKIRGFRPGKVPISMVIRLFSAQIDQEVSQKLMSESLPEALKEFENDLISQPALEESNFSKDRPFTYSVTFEVKPVFELSGYQGLELTREKVNVTKEMVDEKLEDLRQAHATTISLDQERPLANGDLAVIDYKAFVNDEPLEGGANPNYQLEVGSGRFHQDFEEQLIGLNKEEDKEIKVTFAQDHYNPLLAGKEVRFEVKLIDIKEKKLPDLNDDFAKDLSQDLEDLDQLKEQIEADLTKAEERHTQGLLEQQIRENLLALVEMEIPETLVGRELEAMVSNTMFNLKRSGLSMEAMGMSEAKMREDYRPEAEKRVKHALILEKIALNHDISVDQADVDDKLQSLSRDLGQPLEAVKNIYNKNNMMEMLREDLLREKTLKFIIDNANITDDDASDSAGVETSADSGALEEGPSPNNIQVGK